MGGKCRHCGAKISSRYFLIELLTGLLWAVLYLKFGLRAELLFYLIFSAFLIPMAFIDLEHMLIPDILCYPGIAVGLLLNFINGNYRDPVLGMLLGAGFMFLVRIIGRLIYKQEALGEGDIMLVALLGAFLGVKGVTLAVFLGYIVGAIVGLGLLIFKIKGVREAVPFGPLLIIGVLIYVFWGEAILNWYLRGFLL